MSAPPPEPPRLVLPASAAPGAALASETAAAPDGVTYFRVYTVAVALFDVIVMGLGYWMIISPAVSATVTPNVASLFTGLVWTFLSGVHLIASIIALVGGRKRWVHTLGFVLIILSLTSCCFAPFAIAVLIAFNNPQVKQYYSE